MLWGYVHLNRLNKNIVFSSLIPSPSALIGYFVITKAFINMTRSNTKNLSAIKDPLVRDLEGGSIA